MTQIKNNVREVKTSSEFKEKPIHKEDRCEMCGKLGGMGITQGTSGGHILCYDCAEEAKSKDLISIDSDGLWYDYADNRLGEMIKRKNEMKILIGAKERMDGITNTSDREDIKKATRSIIEVLKSDGFESADIYNYIHKLVREGGC